jgi:hypothetical protein
VSLRFDEILALAAPDASDAAEFGWTVLKRNGSSLQKDGERLAGEAETKAELALRIAAFEAGGRATLARLGVI